MAAGWKPYGPIALHYNYCIIFCNYLIVKITVMDSTDVKLNTTLTVTIHSSILKLTFLSEGSSHYKPGLPFYGSVCQFTYLGFFCIMAVKLLHLLPC